MSEHNKFKNESQDARRHDKHNAAHPEEKSGKNRDKLDKQSSKNQKK